LKKTFGRVRNHGCSPLAPTMDHVGPRTRTVRRQHRDVSALGVETRCRLRSLCGRPGKLVFIPLVALVKFVADGLVKGGLDNGQFSPSILRNRSIPEVQRAGKAAAARFRSLGDKGSRGAHPRRERNFPGPAGDHGGRAPIATVGVGAGTCESARHHPATVRKFRVRERLLRGRTAAGTPIRAGQQPAASKQD